MKEVKKSAENSKTTTAKKNGAKVDEKPAAKAATAKTVTTKTATAKTASKPAKDEPKEKTATKPATEKVATKSAKEEPQKKTAATKTATPKTTTKPAKKEVVVEEVVDDRLAANDEVDEVGEEKKNANRPKNYHISLRLDGKWQVKLGKGEKALKLFDTQAQAIAFAKEKAKNQDGHITIHKVDGKIRKQKY